MSRDGSSRGKITLGGRLTPFISDIGLHRNLSEPSEFGKRGYVVENNRRRKPLIGNILRISIIGRNKCRDLITRRHLLVRELELRIEDRA